MRVAVCLSLPTVCTLKSHHQGHSEVSY
jgi:hypothetical protein